jgi:putative endonuclease
MAWVYILQSLKDKKYYIGSTGDLTRRLAEHNRGQNKSTKHRKPFKLIYQEEFGEIFDAKNKEKIIKSYKGGNAFKKLIVQHSERE